MYRHCLSRLIVCLVTYNTYNLHSIDKNLIVIYTINNNISWFWDDMDFNEIKEKPYSLLINELPKIVSSFSTSTILSKGKSHRWNRMHNRKIIKTALIPDEIEKYITNEIKSIDKFLESQIDIAFLIKNSWYISHYPFEVAINELLNKYIEKSENKININTSILIDNLMRKKERHFDTFFAGDLIWLLGVYFNSLIRNSKLITYRNKNMESNFPQDNLFPIKNFSKEITEIDSIDIYKEINNYTGSDCIIYITKSLGNDNVYFDKLEYTVSKNNNGKRPTVIVWELKPCHKITPEKYSINFVQGFSQDNFIKIEHIINQI